MFYPGGASRERKEKKKYGMVLQDGPKINILKKIKMKATLETYPSSIRELWPPWKQETEQVSEFVEITEALLPRVRAIQFLSFNEGLSSYK